MKLTPVEIIQDAVATHKVDEIWGMFSGGHDSLVSSHIASLAPQFKGILHIDTGTGIPDTQQYVIDTCNRYNWHLEIYRAIENTRADGTPDPMIYRDLVLRWGFPGANLHQFMYSRLKERQIHRFVRDRKTSGVKRIGLVTGARIAESDRRKRNFKQGAEIHRREGSRVWIAPTLLFSDDDCQSYMKSYNLPRNPVKDNLCMSGECLCIAGDTLISTPNGWIEIANLEVGDVIHSSIEGCITPQPIYKVYCNDPKPMISLKAYFLPAIDITRNHPIYVRPYQHKTTKIEGVRTSRAQIDAPIYIEAGEIEQKFAQGKTQTVWNQQKFYVGYPFRTEEIPINLTDEQLRLLGYFMAEGAYNWRRDKYRNSKGGIIFTVSAKSETMALDIKLCIEKGLGLPTHWRDWVDDRTGRRFITVRNCGKRSSDWVSCFIDGRYCWEKSFNQSIMLAPVAMQSKILEAMWTGDGSEYTRHREGKTEKNSVYCTTSKVLALQVHEMLLRQGKVYGIRTTKPREKSTSSISAGFRHMYQVGRSNERTRYAFLEDGWLWATVQSVSESEIQQTWNLAIAGEPNYLTHGGLVHNCGAYAQPNELEQLEFFYPEIAARIKALEVEVKAQGFPWGWEDQPPKWWVKKCKMMQLEEQGQLNLFSMPLCHSCEIKFTEM